MRIFRGLAYLFGGTLILRSLARVRLPTNSTTALASRTSPARTEDEWTDSAKELWVSAVLEEYKSLRAESIAVISNLQAVVRNGVAALGVLFAIGFAQVESDVGIIIYSVIVPIFSVLIFLTWANEFTRMVRVGRYIQDVERRINKRIALAPVDGGLGWETWLSIEVCGKPPRLEYYFAVPGVFFGAAFGGNLLVYWVRCRNSLCWPEYWGLMLSSVVLVGITVVVATSRLGGVRKIYDRYFSH